MADMRKKLLLLMAYKAVQAGYLGAMHGSDIYQVAEGWACRVIRDDPGLVIARNGTDFEIAVQNSGIAAIYVPRCAALTQEMATRMLSRNPLSKTILWEV